MALRPASGHPIVSRLFPPGSKAADALLRATWPRAVGAELGARTEVVGLDAGTLRVRVPDARWRGVLHRMRHDILARLRETAGPAAPLRLGFVEGPVAPPARRGAPAPAAPGPAPSAVAAAAAAIEDDALRDSFLQTAARYLARFAR